MRVYAEVVMGLNFLVDFLLILGTNRLAGFPLGVKRAAGAAALGAVYALGCLMPGFRFLGNPLWRLVSLVLMAVVAFGWDSSAVRRGAVFALLAMALGGVAAGFGSGSVWMPILGGGILFLLCRVGFGVNPGGREYLPLEIRHQGKVVNLTALRDTGNALRDPITGERVLVIDSRAASELTGLTGQQLSAPLENLGRIPGLRLIPYRTVGGGGMLLAMRFPKVRVGTQWRSALVAFAPEEIGRGEGFRALTV